MTIFPNATDIFQLDVPLDVPFDDPALFNATVERFFRTPFVKKDRINDTLKSFERLRASLERRLQ